MIKYLKLARIHQYSKNLLIFLPLIFSGKLLEENNIFIGFFLFLSFSLMASCVYIINDIKDLEYDKAHPVKKYRTIASGAISIKRSLLFAITLFIISIFISFFISLDIIYVLLFYFTINILYSLGLKNIIFIDIIIVSIGFLLRIYFGSIPFEIIPSSWLLVLTFVSSLFLSFAKRKSEMEYLKQNIKSRKNNGKYNLKIINIGLLFFSFCIVLLYTLYCFFGFNNFKEKNLIFIYLSSIFVITGVARYLNLIYIKKTNHTPDLIIIKDLFMKIISILWIISVLIAVYG